MYEMQEYKAPLTAVEIKAQVQLIQQVMSSVMVKDVHYGTIPGTQKPTLYKAGAEKILSTFRIGVDPSGESITDLSTPDEVRYRVAVKGFDQINGAVLGVGIGECSSNEEKYKWRKPVCDEEFNETPDDRKRTVWKKVFNKDPYQVKQIRTNPSDVANTILKMAKKRAQIDMTLTVTAASDVFDQDLEDMPEELRESVTTKSNGRSPLKKPEKKSKANTSGKSVEIIVSEIEIKEGEKDGKPWTMYGIKDDEGTIYKTFSETFADLANSAKEMGSKIKIKYSDGKYGFSVINLEVVNEG